MSISSLPTGKLLALDVGLARIGIATCDGLGLVSRPLEVLERRSRREDFAHLAQLVEREAAQTVLCGLPLNMDGSEGGQAQTTRKWAMRLAQALRTLLGRPIPIVFWDERMSTYAAQEVMARHPVTAGEDAVAAAVILQDYLDAQRQGILLAFGRIDLPQKSGFLAVNPTFSQESEE